MQSDLQASIEHWFAQGPAAIGNPEALSAFPAAPRRARSRHSPFRRADATAATGWRVNAWVKQGILLGFRLGHLIAVGDDAVLSCVDKHTYPTRRFTPEQNIRIVTAALPFVLELTWLPA